MAYHKLPLTHFKSIYSLELFSAIHQRDILALLQDHDPDYVKCLMYKPLQDLKELPFGIAGSEWAPYLLNRDRLDALRQHAMGNIDSTTLFKTFYSIEDDYQVNVVDGKYFATKVGTQEEAYRLPPDFPEPKGDVLPEFVPMTMPKAKDHEYKYHDALTLFIHALKTLFGEVLKGTFYPTSYHEPKHPPHIHVPYETAEVRVGYEDATKHLHNSFRSYGHLSLDPRKQVVVKDKTVIPWDYRLQDIAKNLPRLGDGLKMLKEVVPHPLISFNGEDTTTFLIDGLETKYNVLELTLTLTLDTPDTYGVEVLQVGLPDGGEELIYATTSDTTTFRPTLRVEAKLYNLQGLDGFRVRVIAGKGKEAKVLEAKLQVSAYRTKHMVYVPSGKGSVKHDLARLYHRVAYTTGCTKGGTFKPNSTFKTHYRTNLKWWGDERGLQDYEGVDSFTPEVVKEVDRLFHPSGLKAWPKDRPNPSLDAYFGLGSYCSGCLYNQQLAGTLREGEGEDYVYPYDYC